MRTTPGPASPLRADGEHPSGQPVVSGGGPLAEALRARRLPGAGLTIAAGLTTDLSAVLALQQRTLATGRNFLPCRGIGPAVEIGPLVLPGKPGCAGCADIARRRAAAGNVPAVLAGEPFRQPPEQLYPLVAELVIHRLAEPDHADPLLVQVIDLVEFRITGHLLRPVPDCESCDCREDDSADAARWAAVPRPQVGAAALRAGPGPDLALLEHSLLDARFGPVTSARQSDTAPLAHVVLDIAGPRHRQTHGRADTAADARRLGLLEAVERDSGAHPNARRTIVHGSHLTLSGRCVDPVDLGLPDPALSGHPRFRLTPYTPDLPMWWVWGQQLASGAPILVPEQVAYYGTRHEPRVFSETSTGCATGTCLEEAVLHGLLEVLERDAFLLAWYQRDPGVRLAGATLADPVSAELVSRAATEGYEVRLHDVTSDVGIPVVLACAVAPGAPVAFLTTAAAHVDGMLAIRAALIELVAMLSLRRAAPFDSEHRDALLADPAAVRTITDHVALHSHPRALPALGWLLDAARTPVAAEEQFAPAAGHWQHTDLTEVLRRVVGAARAAQLDPIAVRQTTDRDRALGLEVVKVLAPGAVPLTVGGVHHRVRGLPRLRPAEPVLPHPFP